MNTKFPSTIVKPNDFYFEVAMGHVNGANALNKYGENASIALGTQEGIWDGSVPYPFPLTEDITHISQPVHDAGMAGQIVRVQGVDTDFDYVDQNVALHATDTTIKMPLAKPLRRVFRESVVSSVVAIQAINTTNAAGTITYAVIIAGNQQTMMAIMPVFRNKVFLITNWNWDVIKVTGNIPDNTAFTIWTADVENNTAFRIRRKISQSQLGSGGSVAINPPIVVEQISDIMMTASPDTKPAGVTGGFDGVMIDNGVHPAF